LGQKTKELGAQIGTAKTLECSIEQKELVINELQKKKIDEHEEELKSQRNIIQANKASISEHVMKKSELEDSVQSLQSLLNHASKCNQKKCDTCKEIRNQHTLEKTVELGKTTKAHSGLVSPTPNFTNSQQRSLFARTLGKLFGGSKTASKTSTNPEPATTKKEKAADKKKSKTAVSFDKASSSKKKSSVDIVKPGKK